MMSAKVCRVPCLQALLFAAAAQGLLVPTALAQATGDEDRFSVEVGYEAEATDNVRREETGTRDDIIHRPRLSLGYAQGFNRVDLSAAYRLEARRYQRSSFSSDEVISGRSAMNVALVPGSLQWMTDHVRTENLIDRRQADRPDNRRESNTLGTGLTYQFGGRSPNQVTAQARAELFDSNRGFDDSLRYIGSVSYRRLTSPVQSVGLSLSGTKVDYDEELVPDFDRWTVQATFNRQLRTVGVDLGVGYNEVRRSGFSSSGGLALTADAFWEPAAGHRFTASASRRFTDRTRATLQGIPEFGDDREQGAADGNVFEETQFGLGYSFQRERWSYRLSLNWADEDYDTVARDTRRLGVRMNVGYRINPDLDLDFSVRGTRRDFRDENRKDDLLSSDLRLRWAVGRKTALSLGVGYEERDSDAGGRNYDERRVVLGITYQLL
ncbi:MAG: outer membrane beta-barrel protein [Gammaproteobacteria bacterium]|nr:outer membrane beta-barrel protein [Gammaproteobacteria bacterium]